MAPDPITRPVMNTLVQPKTRKPINNICKNLFIVVHVIFGIDFGFVRSKSPKTNAIIKLITLVHTTGFFVTVTAAYSSVNHDFMYVFESIFFEMLVYYVHSLTMLFAKNTFHEYCAGLSAFDTEINVDTSTYRFECKFICWFLITFVFKLGIWLADCVFHSVFCELPFYIQPIYYIMLMGGDIALIVYTCVFYCGYLRIKKFSSFLKKDDADVVSCQYLYVSFVRIIKKVKQSFDVVLIYTLVAITSDTTLACYAAFFDETVYSFEDSVVMYTCVGQRLLMLFSPAILAGMLANQVEKLKLVLYAKLLKDKSHAKDIKRFVAYIEGQPLRFKVWRVVPLDWRMPVLVLDIAATYIIVAIQFRGI